MAKFKFYPRLLWSEQLFYDTKFHHYCTATNIEIIFGNILFMVNKVGYKIQYILSKESLKYSKLFRFMYLSLLFVLFS